MHLRLARDLQRATLAYPHRHVAQLPLLFWLVLAALRHAGDKAVVPIVHEALVHVLRSGRVQDPNIPTVDTSDKTSYTALWYACNWCDIKGWAEALVPMARALMTADARGLFRVPFDLNRKDIQYDGRPYSTPLAVAAARGEAGLPMVRLVANHPRADLNALDLVRATRAGERVCARGVNGDESGWTGRCVCGCMVRACCCG